MPDQLAVAGCFVIAPDHAHFCCDYSEVLARIDRIDVKAYDQSRNHLAGAVTWLSPFITHGIISTSTVAERVLQKNSPASCYRLLYELAWREYFHRVWQLRGEGIFSDIGQAQVPVTSQQLPVAVAKGETGVQVLDTAIKHFLQHGALHNHARMWLAGITCNTARTAWLEPARWMHYHLLDGDLASNTLSWQWVAGTFSQKKYIANQQNLNKYSDSTQRETWLDQSYEALAKAEVPDVLRARADADLSTELPGEPITRPTTGTVALRSIWQLDPLWQSTAEQQVLYIDSQLHANWPLSPRRWQFIEHWASRIPDLEVYKGTIGQLALSMESAAIIRTEYPATRSWPGVPMERDWLYPMPVKPFNSFSQYWKQVKATVL